MLLSSTVKKYPKYYYKHPLTRRAARNAPIETQRVYPVLTAELLLKRRIRRKVMDEVRVTCGAPIEYFNALYKQLIENYVEFVQNLPIPNNFRITRIDRQMYLASLALSLREPYLLAGSLLNRATDNEKALWNYVIFSGLLLSRLGQLVTQYKVCLCDEKGVFLKEWEPFVGAMHEQGSYYKIRSIESGSSPVDSQFNVMLARQLMPEEGYNWIASVPEALEQWIQSLDDSGERDAGTLSARFFVVMRSWLAQRQEFLEGEFIEAFELYLENLEDTYDYSEELEEDLPLTEVKEPLETLTGERFYQWLRRGIHDKSLTVNEKDSAVFMTKQGVLLLHPKTFEKFIKEHPEAGTPEKVFDQFSKIGLVASNKLESYIAKFPGMREQNVKGVLLRDAGSLFGHVQPPPLSKLLYAPHAFQLAIEKTIDKRLSVDAKLTQEKDKAHEQDLDAQEKQTEQKLPNLKQQGQSTPSYKEFNLTNKPPMKR